MTSGTKTRNGNYYGSSYCSSSTTYTDFYQKTWSGTDRPKTNILRYTNVYRKGGSIRKVWHKPIKSVRCEMPENPYTCIWTIRKDPPMSMRIGSPPKWETGSVMACYGGGVNGQTDPFTSNDYNSLIGKLRSRIQGSELHIGIAVAEVDKTLIMLRHRAATIGRYVYYMKRGRFDKAARALFGERHNRKLKSKDIASVHLELQYGWKPILSDAFAAAKTLEHYTSKPRKYTFRVSSQVAGPRPVSQYSGYRFTLASNQTKVWLKAVLTERNTASLVGLLDPASILWERLPWSFVIDWWLPIGNYLEARGVASALSGTFVTSRKWVYKWGNPVAIGNWSILAPGYFREEGKFSREISRSLITLKPTLKGFKEGLSWQHAANAVALIRVKAPQVQKNVSAAWRDRDFYTE